MKSKFTLISFRVKNYKAVQDSKTIKFTPLTAFISNNDSKRGNIEGLEKGIVQFTSIISEHIAPISTQKKRNQVMHLQRNLFEQTSKRES